MPLVKLETAPRTAARNTPSERTCLAALGFVREAVPTEMREAPAGPIIAPDASNTAVAWRGGQVMGLEIPSSDLIVIGVGSEASALVWQQLNIGLVQNQLFPATASTSTVARRDTDLAAIIAEEQRLDSALNALLAAVEEPEGFSEQEHRPTLRYRIPK